MLAAIRKFFDERMAERPGEAAGAAAHRARLAAAALMVEVLRADDEAAEAERHAVLEALARKFGLDAEESRALVALAEVEAREAHDCWQFTSAINAGFSPQQKERLVEELWRVAFADGSLHRREEHLIRRVADLIHVPHSAFIRAKLRVQEGGGA